ncbi:MAG: alpha-D-glucose phosphate-specific phosphoglucomutase [Gammaproteobacteria bacterium]
MNLQDVSTTPFPDQRPGTAGLRRKVAVFRQQHYLENFLQSIFDSAGEFRGSTVVAGGDGRFYNRQALQTLTEMAAANGIARLIVGAGGLLSTPAASLLIRDRGALGGFLLTASHNPGGPNGDFGLKFNTASGGQASEALTQKIYQASRSLTLYRTTDLDPLDFDQLGEQQYGELRLEIIDPVIGYADKMESLFDFDRIRRLFSGNFRMRFDAMHAVTGPYAEEIFVRRLGAPAESIANGSPLEDFGGGHPDPNPVDAASLVRLMGSDQAPDFAAASDGDGDRNMILGRGLMVSPGDSLAILAANAHQVPGYASGLAGVARSMPTSRAIDVVAERLELPCFETPTGWRFFCNLLEAGKIDLCGEESFGTSSSHAREKDGLWAVLFWLNLIAISGKDVPTLVSDHWREYGRHAYCRHDYFIPDPDLGREVFAGLEAAIGKLVGRSAGQTIIGHADIFSYLDPVDGSVSDHQGVRIMLNDGSRIVFRLSGTGTAGATLRIYLERFVPIGQDCSGAAARLTADLGRIARDIADLPDRTGLHQPSGII